MQALENFFSKDRMLRLGAFLIDMVVLGLLLSIWRGMTGLPDFMAVQKEIDAIMLMETMEQQQAQTAIAIKAFQESYNVAIIGWAIYEVIVQILFKGQTVGKKICGFRVVSKKASDGSFVTFLRVTFRSVYKVLCTFLFRGLPVLISWIYIFGNEQNRAGYDVFAGTKVVRTR